jgi:O-antigen ligase
VTYGAQHLVAALGLHLPVAIMGRGKWRVAGVAGSAATIVGLLATGARGPWLAAVALAVLVLVVAIIRIPDSRRRARFALGASAISIIAAALLWTFAGREIASRFEQARDEISRAVEHRDFQKADGSRVGDDSSRVAMVGWALEAIREHPVLGVGTGGYTRYVQDTKQADGAVYEDFVRRWHGHCHNAILHEWATTGLVGLLIMLLFWGVAVRGAFSSLTWASLGTYAAGPAFALVGYLMLAPFEAIQANGTTGKLLFALMAICPAWYPNSPSEARAQARAPESTDNLP